jgi:hypothetical protein
MAFMMLTLRIPPPLLPDRFQEDVHIQCIRGKITKETKSKNTGKSTG